MNNGIETRLSRYSVEETVSRLENLLRDRGIRLFCFIDHSGEAIAAGFEMRPTKLLVFGAPKSGTPVMLAAPDAALDLPLKLLIAELPDGTVQISWNSPSWLQQRHGFPEALLGNIAAAEALANAAAT